MKSLDELKKNYRDKLESFPFETKEEGLTEGILNCKIAEKEEFTALETPYTMKQKTKKKAAENTKSKEFVEEDSSEGESTDEDPYYGDIMLNMDLFVKGKQIIDDSQITIVRNEKYGLVGRNGIGKTTLLKAIRRRKFDIPKGLKIHAIKQDYVSDEKVIDYVGADAGKILQGLGFSKDQQQQTLHNLSGGWRMRAQLAKAIHLNPDLLLLDEPTNFLDIRAIAWLEHQIKQLKTVIIVSHDRNFLNNTVENILHLNDMKIDVYKGNYSTFVKLRENKLVSQVREYESQMAQRAHLQSFIDRFRANASRSSQAQSKIKLLEKMPILHLPTIEPKIQFQFKCNVVKGVLLELENASFTYKNKEGDSRPNKQIFNDLSLRIDHTSRIVIVGENGQGKSTLLKLLTLNLKPDAGKVEIHPALKAGYFAQHHVDHLDHNEYALTYLMKTYKEEESRCALANFGLNINNQRIGTLSGGQKSRMAFAMMNLERPNLLVLDEPTNHLDMETIEALADAVNRYEGAVICVSHDLAFIERAFKSVYICENGKLTPFNGTATEYKDSLII